MKIAQRDPAHEDSSVTNHEINLSTNVRCLLVEETTSRLSTYFVLYNRSRQMLTTVIILSREREIERLNHSSLDVHHPHITQSHSTI